MPPGPYVVLPLIGPANVNSTLTLASAIALEVYALSFISTTLAAADFIVIDLGGSAAALRNMNDIPEGADPYLTQRTQHLDYVEKGCAPKAAAPKAAPPKTPPPRSAEPPVKFRRADASARPIEAFPARLRY
jgi:phospholipid-binding lipoprotein MlaA